MTTCEDCVARVLGACRGDFCDMERVGLTEQTQRAAESGGHTLSSFKKTAGRPVWTASCTRCGRDIAYTLDPEPGAPAIYGSMLDAACRDAD